MGTTRRPPLVRRAVGVTSAFALSLGALPLMATPAAAASLIDIGVACDNAPASTLNDANTTPTPSGDSNWQDVVDCLSAANGYTELDAGWDDCGV